MSYSDKRPLRDRLVAAGPTLLIQAAVGYVLLSGLAITTLAPPERTLLTKNVPLVPPPEPDSLPDTPPPSAKSVSDPRPYLPSAEVTTTTIDVAPVPSGPVFVDLPPMADAPAVTPPIEKPVDLGRGVAPLRSQGDWFPRDAYPAAARRAGAEGRVSVAVDVGTTGRVTACRVTASSGSEDLDAATCRLASRNGRFRPALDSGGQPTAATYTLRNVRWVLEE